MSTSNTPSHAQQLTYEQRARAARERLRDVLAPISDQERAAMDHLGRVLSDLPTLETLAMMVERAVREATGDGYERGWREAGGRP